MSNVAKSFDGNYCEKVKPHQLLSFLYKLIVLSHTHTLNHMTDFFSF